MKKSEFREIMNQVREYRTWLRIEAQNTYCIYNGLDNAIYRKKVNGGRAVVFFSHNGKTGFERMLDVCWRYAKLKDSSYKIGSQEYYNTFK